MQLVFAAAVRLDNIDTLQLCAWVLTYNKSDPNVNDFGAFCSSNATQAAALGQVFDNCSADYRYKTQVIIYSTWLSQCHM